MDWENNNRAHKYVINDERRPGETGKAARTKQAIRILVLLAAVAAVLGVVIRYTVVWSQDSSESQLSSTTSPTLSVNSTVTENVSTHPTVNWSTPQLESSSSASFHRTTSQLTTILQTSEDIITETSTFSTTQSEVSTTTTLYTTDTKPPLSTDFTTSIKPPETSLSSTTQSEVSTNNTTLYTTDTKPPLSTDSTTSIKPPETSTSSTTQSEVSTTTTLYTTHTKPPLLTDSTTSIKPAVTSTSSTIPETITTGRSSTVNTPYIVTTSDVDTTAEALTTQEETTTSAADTTWEDVTTTTVIKEVTTEEFATTEIPEEAWPYTYGPNLDLGSHISSAGFRKGQATDNHTCNHVREVPEYLRSKEEMYTGINVFYQKYTEAYGIPVLGSINVTDVGLKRACYVIRFMLASRYDIRNTIYKFYIRVALIGDDEQQTSLWDYRDFDSSYWDARARGLGATVHIPLASAGDDNSRCKVANRYPNNDILIHEFAHGIHQFGATFTVPRFEIRLKALYDKAKAEGRYNNTYMGNNRNEYWAVGTEIYMESFEGGGYVYDINGTQVALRDRHSLALYDPGLVELMREVYPCPNTLRNRCQFKRSPDCGLSNYQLLYAEIYRAAPQCPIDKVWTGISSAEACVAKACHRQKQVFGFKVNGKCVTYNCPDPNSFGFKVGGTGYSIYTQQVPFPEVASKEPEEELQQLCTRPLDIPGRCDVEPDQRVQCGPEVQTASQCEARGCCYLDKECFYSITSECTNKLYYCPDDAANGGYCDSPRRQTYMSRKCAMSCDLGVCESFRPES